jgi:hypothetical protein
MPKPSKALLEQARKLNVKITRKSSDGTRRYKTQAELHRDIKNRRSALTKASGKKVYRLSRKYTKKTYGGLMKRVLPKHRVYHKPITFEQARRAFEAYYKGKEMLRKKQYDLKHRSPVVLDSRYLTRHGPHKYDFIGVDLGTKKVPGLKKRVYISKQTDMQANKLMQEAVVRKVVARSSKGAQQKQRGSSARKGSSAVSTKRTTKK